MFARTQKMPWRRGLVVSSPPATKETGSWVMRLNPARAVVFKSRKEQKRYVKPAKLIMYYSWMKPT
jgi:hypothetical protein